MLAVSMKLLGESSHFTFRIVHGICGVVQVGVHVVYVIPHRIELLKILMSDSKNKNKKKIYNKMRPGYTGKSYLA